MYYIIYSRLLKINIKKIFNWKPLVTKMIKISLSLNAKTINNEDKSYFLL